VNFKIATCLASFICIKLFKVDKLEIKWHGLSTGTHLFYGVLYPLYVPSTFNLNNKDVNTPTSPFLCWKSLMYWLKDTSEIEIPLQAHER
jgi:hypothetical protein